MKHKPIKVYLTMAQNGDTSIQGGYDQLRIEEASFIADLIGCLAKIVNYANGKKVTRSLGVEAKLTLQP